MKIAVTGALGHIGSRLIRELPRVFSSASIVMIDNFLTQRYCSLFQLPADGKYTFLEGDILNDDLTLLFAGCDVVVHLAAITEAAGSFEQQEKTEEVNYVGTERVARVCAAMGIPLVFLSTCSVYGTTKDVVDEECDPDEIKPQTPYAMSKHRGELMLTELGRTEKLHFVTLRFGTIVGASPGMRFHTAANKFCFQACAGLPISVWKTAYDQRRPYLELSDAVRSICFLIQREKFDRSVYNVLTAQTTVLSFVELIRKEVPDLKVELVDSSEMNSLSYDVSRKKIESLGFRFQGSLELAVEETVGLLRGMRSSPVESLILPKL